MASKAKVIRKSNAKKDRFGRSRASMRHIAENARKAPDLGEFLDWYRNFVTYTSTIKKPFVTSNANDDRLLLAAIGIASEGGELLDVHKKVYFHDHKRRKTMSPDRRVKAVKEAGDIMWYFFVWLDMMGLDIREVIQTNMDKLSEDPR